MEFKIKFSLRGVISLFFIFLLLLLII